MDDLPIKHADFPLRYLHGFGHSHPFTQDFPPAQTQPRRPAPGRCLGPGRDSAFLP